MYFKLLVFSAVLLVVTVQAIHELTKEGLACAAQSNVSKETLSLFIDGQGDMPVDDEGIQNFMDCRYGRYFDGNNDNKMVNDEDSRADVAMYFRGIMNGKPKLAALLAGVLIDKCNHIGDKNKGKSIVMTANCGIAEFHTYDISC